jgi:hypothetical protein
MRLIALADAIAFVVAWLGFLLYIADRPPPPRFTIVLALLIGLGVAVYFYYLSLLPRIGLGERKLAVKSLLHWAIAGFALGLMLSFLPGGEPSLPATGSTVPNVILVGVVTAMAAVTGIAIYVMNLVLLRWLAR